MCAANYDMCSIYSMILANVHHAGVTSMLKHVTGPQDLLGVYQPANWLTFKHIHTIMLSGGYSTVPLEECVTTASGYAAAHPATDMSDFRREQFEYMKGQLYTLLLVDYIINLPTCCVVSTNNFDYTACATEQVYVQFSAQEDYIKVQKYSTVMYIALNSDCVVMYNSSRLTHVYQFAELLAPFLLSTDHQADIAYYGIGHLLIVFCFAATPHSLLPHIKYQTESQYMWEGDFVHQSALHFVPIIKLQKLPVIESVLVSPPRLAELAGSTVGTTSKYSTCIECTRWAIHHAATNLLPGIALPPLLNRFRSHVSTTGYFLLKMDLDRWEADHMYVRRADYLFQTEWDKEHLTQRQYVMGSNAMANDCGLDCFAWQSNAVISLMDLTQCLAFLSGPACEECSAHCYNTKTDCVQLSLRPMEWADVTQYSALSSRLVNISSYVMHSLQL